MPVTVNARDERSMREKYLKPDRQVKQPDPLPEMKKSAT